MTVHAFPRLAFVALVAGAIAAPNAMAIGGGSGHGHLKRKPVAAKASKQASVAPVRTGANGVVCFQSPPVPC